jgi:hypothetical protein
MNSTIRFLAGGLASVAVASTVTLAGATAYAADEADRGCGQPAVPPVLATVISEPVLRLVPAVTHDEWRWERDTTTLEHEFTKLISPAGSESDWVRAGTLQRLWSHKVVDRAAVEAVPGTDEQGHAETVVVTPAVTVTLFEYVQQQTGRTRWEKADWNTQDGDADTGKGWTRTGATRDDVVTEAVTKQVWVVDEEATEGTPAIPELSHLEYSWSETSPGSGWSGPLDSPIVGGGETATTSGDETPPGDGWTKTATREVPAVFDTLWAVTEPDGYAATGDSRIKSGPTEQTSDPSADAPPGDGWRQVAGSQVVVVDHVESTELVSPGSVVQVEVTPGLPATPACTTVAAAPAGSAVVSPSGATAAPAHHAAGHAGSQVAAAQVGTVLPEAGSPVSPLLLTAGLGALLAGGVLVGAGRRRNSA